MLATWDNTCMPAGPEACTSTDFENLAMLLSEDCSQVLNDALNPENWEADLRDEECTCLLDVDQDTASTFDCLYRTDGTGSTLYGLWQQCYDSSDAQPTEAPEDPTVPFADCTA